MIRARLALPLVAGALLVAGCGSSSEQAANPSAGQGQGQRPPSGGFLGGSNLTKLADALGVSKAKLQTAMKNAMPQGGPPSGGGAPPSGGQGGPPSGTGGPPAGAGGPPGGQGNQLAKQLAKELNLPEAKVTKALRSVMPTRPQAPANGQSPS